MAKAHDLQRHLSQLGVITITPSKTANLLGYGVANTDRGAATEKGEAMIFSKAELEANYRNP